MFNILSEEKMIAFIGLIVGIIIGIVWKVNIPDKFSPYISVAILACLDSVFGAIRSSLSKNFEADIFISGFSEMLFLQQDLLTLVINLEFPYTLRQLLYLEEEYLITLL